MVPPPGARGPPLRAAGGREEELARRRRGCAGGGAGGRRDPTLAVTPAASSGGFAAPCSGRAPPCLAPELGAGLWLDQRRGDAASPDAASGAEFHRCSCRSGAATACPGRTALSFPRRRSQDARGEPQGIGGQPQQIGGEVGRDWRAGGGYLSLCSVSAPARSAALSSQVTVPSCAL